MKRELSQAFAVGKALLFILWPTTAYAAQLTFGDQIAANPMLQFALTITVSTLMGATSLLHAMRHEYEKNDGVIKHLWLFVWSRMLGANGAGLFVFFGPDMPYKTGAIMLAAFAGTAFLEKLADKFIEKREAP